jgi:kumamolisin
VAIGAVVVACVGLGLAFAGTGTTQASSTPSTSHGSTQSSSGGARWAELLSLSTDLGRARSTPVYILVTLSSSRRPSELETWARQRGLRVLWYSDEQFCVLGGSAQAMSSALGVRIDNYVSRSGEHFYSSVRQPEIPGSLRSEVTGLGLVSNYGRQSPQATPATYVPNGGLSQSGLLQAYQATPLSQLGDKGQGETVVFIESGPFEQSDVNTYTQKFGLPSVQVKDVGGLAPGGASESDEADMDIQVVHAIAPQANLVYWNLLGTPGLTNNTDFGSAIALSIAAATKEFPGAIYSISLGDCELDNDKADETAISSAASAAEAGGSTVYASSGDTGGADCEQNGADSLNSSQGVEIPAAASNVTGVGGTAVSVTTSGDYLGETTWSWPMESQGSGGGVSTISGRPSWQTGPGVGGQGVSDGREVPDVAADADPVTGTPFVSDGKVLAGNGTSLATPIWAGMTALMDEFLHNNGQSPIGFANPTYYRLAADSALTPTPFHDITIGGNVFFRATTGFDPVTGLGSPDVAALAQDVLDIDKGTLG